MQTHHNGHIPGQNGHIAISTAKSKYETATHGKHPLPSASQSNSPIDNQLGPDIYSTTLPWWRAAIRTQILSSVEWESRVIAKMQERIRTPWLDAYFVYTSSLGTHTFFMIALPLLFFFGYAELGRGLVFVLASGVYFSSFVKDLICSPRPLAPPVTRLTIGTHHLEYGFPSTHSTNSVSIALFIFSHVHRAYMSSSESAGMSQSTYYLSCILLFIYALSIVFGRLYTAMHSFTDCVFGVLLGTAIWGAHLIAGEFVERWLESGGWIVPLTITPLCLLLVHYHPQPVDDCPCFEDAIAFVSVILGIFLARWHTIHAGVEAKYMESVMPGNLEATWQDLGVWWSVAGAKMGVGILTIFAWRLLAKSTLHAVLPPLFRTLSMCITLPHRRFYTPATDYANVPMGGGGGGALRSIPSVIDLPGMIEVDVSGRGEPGLGVPTGMRGGELKRRGGGNGIGAGTGNRNGSAHDNGSANELEKAQPSKQVEHYDADVLTKVVVYAGIAALAAEGIPIMFSLFGWGVKPW
ncbi:hypothetical protein BJ138DRAFT_1019219 [Hygrophoropsis aurantiaca]|uniref:Uncharacterized protein n=1 Tax=Hygrophoropsis aurantiaca TaxID=72124 RepID=A0ACB7ZT88_9AGAM|nr:hypothetical protein BJ138DRAFT_1019219 [Hygrophoropsis aurantiaca]